MKVVKKPVPKTGRPTAGAQANAHPADSENLKNASGQFERKLIQDTLTETRWNKTLAAEMLGISRRTLFRKMKATGLS